MLVLVGEMLYFFLLPPNTSYSTSHYAIVVIVFAHLLLLCFLSDTYRKCSQGGREEFLALLALGGLLVSVVDILLVSLCSVRLWPVAARHIWTIPMKSLYNASSDLGKQFMQHVQVLLLQHVPQAVAYTERRECTTMHSRFSLMIPLVYAYMVRSFSRKVSRICSSSPSGPL